jgi:hypothetical protein
MQARPWGGNAQWAPVGGNTHRRPAGGKLNGRREVATLFGNRASGYHSRYRRMATFTGIGGWQHSPVSAGGDINRHWGGDTIGAGG